MSIETEKWVASGSVVYTEDTGLKVAQVDDNWPEEWAKKFAVLPEALALLKQLATTGDDLELIRDEAEALCRRAGVLK